MALIKFDSKSFIEALEPGLVAYVVQQFQDRLEKKLNEVIAETHKELQKEIPDNIKVKIHQFFDLEQNERNIRVVVDLRDGIRGKA